ncbi:hypothetical protein YC2023_041976 [Brassica napus]
MTNKTFALCSKLCSKPYAEVSHHQSYERQHFWHRWGEMSPDIFDSDREFDLGKTKDIGNDIFRTQRCKQFPGFQRVLLCFHSSSFIVSRPRDIRNGSVISVSCCTTFATSSSSIQRLEEEKKVKLASLPRIQFLITEIQVC